MLMLICQLDENLKNHFIQNFVENMEKLKHLTTATRVGEMNMDLFEKHFWQHPEKLTLIPAAPTWMHVGIIWGLYKLVICGSTSSQSDLIYETWALGALNDPAAAAAAAKSLQSCLTLCDAIDGSPPGSPIPGILQARTLEWVAISFSNA